MLLCPIVSEDFKKTSEDIAKHVCRKDAVLEAVGLDKGPMSIESTYETVMSEPFATQKIIEAEKRGFMGRDKLHVR